MGEEGRTELDDVTNSAHDQEADTDGLRDLQELLLISYRRFELAKHVPDNPALAWLWQTYASDTCSGTGCHL